MNDSRIDALARALGSAGSRRKALGLLAGAAGLAALPAAGDARKQPKPCPDGQTRCTVTKGKKKLKVCVDLQITPTSCGACGAVCPDGQRNCVGGVCAACPAGYESVNGGCFQIIDINNGQQANVCIVSGCTVSGSVLDSGNYLCGSATATTCAQPSDCAEGLACYHTAHSSICIAPCLA